MFTADDYTNSNKPYEFLYSFKDNPFQQQQMIERIKAQAASVKIKGFMTLWNMYLKSMSGDIVPEGANVTEFDGLPLGTQLISGKYICTSDGVSVVDGFGVQRVICPHPIAPIRRFKNVDSGEELLEIWYRRGTKEHKIKDYTHITPKDTIANNILSLAKYGVAVNKRNDKDLSAYLMDMEEYNYDTLKEEESVKRLGWVGEGFQEFSPYVKDIYFDGEEDYGGIFHSVESYGDYDVWKEAIRKVRKEKTAARYYLAASFASVILKPCGLLPFLVHAWGGSENGKAQPLDTKIITPYGHKLMGDIEIDDMVIGGDGKAHKVIGVYPQGLKDVYRLTFSDGSSTRCCKEHLWNVTTRTRRNHNRGYTTMSLEDMMKRPIKGKRGYEYRIPVCKPVEYDSQSELPIHPYALGALIGDGCLTLKRNPANRSTTVYFSNTEQDVVDMVNKCLKQNDVYFYRNAHTQCQYVMRGEGTQFFKGAIISLGLNRHSTERFIPDEYLQASIEERKQLLYGLIDTDGFVGHEKHTVRYTTKSLILANDVKTLCLSLGYRATISISRDCEYTVHIITDDSVFLSEKHSKHKESVRRVHKEDKTSMALVSVEYVGKEECQCIMLDSEDHTYLCDDFIVTHNTVALMLAASVWADPEPGEYVATFNGTRFAQETRAGFLNNLPMCLDELQIQTSQGVKDFDDIIYQLCEGVSKSQGKASGGLRKQTRWRNVILSNGEHTIIKPLSGGGARNRVIEIEAPNKIYSDLVGLCETINHNYGFAGHEFVQWLMESDNMERVKALQKDFYHRILEHDVTEKQAGSASAILTADSIVTDLIFEDGMALTVDEMAEVLLRKGDIDINKKTVDWLYDYVAQNSVHFDSDRNTEIWGKVDDDEGNIYIIRSVFEREMKANNLDPKSFLSWAVRTGIVIPGRDNVSQVKKIPGAKGACRVICLRMASEGVFTDVSEDEELPF